MAGEAVNEEAGGALLARRSRDQTLRATMSVVVSHTEARKPSRARVKEGVREGVVVSMIVA
jgi:hypothetical protein